MADDIEAGKGDAPTEPLVADLPPEPELKGPLKPIPETTPRERLAAGLGMVAIILALVAMITQGGILVILAGLTTFIMGPYAYWQQAQLTDIATLKETTAKVEQEVNRFKTEVGRLEKNNEELGTAIDGLQDVEEALAVITAVEGESIVEFETQVQQAREILEQRKKNSKGSLINMMLDTIYRGDENVDNIISEDEVSKVAEGFKMLGGYKVHEDRLHNLIAGKSIDHVMDLIQNLLQTDDLPEEERVFEHLA